MSRSLSLLLFPMLVACATGCVAAPAEGDEDLGSTAQAITNGDEDEDDPAVVALLVQGQVECTGVLVTKSIVVTAGHCVSESPPDEVFFGSHPGAKSGGTRIKVADAAAHPDFDQDSLENDVGIVALASRAPVAPMKIYADSFDDSFKNMAVRLVGFGATGGTGDSTTLRKRTGATKIDSWTDKTFKFHAQPSQTCNGDSGGPAFATVDGEEVVVGITSSGDSDCKSHATDTRIDAYADFIQGYAKKYSATTHAGAVQNSGCSSSPRAPGSSGVAVFAAAALALAWKRRRAS